MTAQFEDLRLLLAENSIQPDAPWVGVEFSGSEEVPVSLAATNDLGLYRETGLIQLHVVAEARIGVGDSLTNRGQTLWNLFRGRTIGGIMIDGVSPTNTQAGATLEFSDGYMSATLILKYHYDLAL